VLPLDGLCATIFDFISDTICVSTADSLSVIQSMPTPGIPHLWYNICVNTGDALMA